MQQGIKFIFLKGFYLNCSYNLHMLNDVCNGQRGLFSNFFNIHIRRKITTDLYYNLNNYYNLFIKIILYIYNNWRKYLKKFKKILK